MTLEEALQQVVKEGAIREYRLSDNLAFVYRLKGNVYQARGLYVGEDGWRLGERLVSAKQLNSPDGWYDVFGLPWQAKAIEMQAAKQNPGYARAILQQCYTCKQVKPLSEFERAGNGLGPHRDWECNECYERRLRELQAYRRQAPRKGDYLDKETLASPPPPEGRI